MIPDRMHAGVLDAEHGAIGRRLGFGVDGQRWTSARRCAPVSVLPTSLRHPVPGRSEVAPVPADDVAVTKARRIEGGRPLPADLAGAVVALGNFDGFHLGHQAVVDRALRLAHRRGVATIVATFDPHPVRHFRPDTAPFRLSSLDQRQRLLGAAGVDALMVCRFDGDLANLTPEQFVDGWLKDASGIVTGEDYAFGRGRSGDRHLLAALSAARGLSCETAGPVFQHGDIVSSSRIRTLLRQGECEEAKRLLSRPYTLHGELKSQPDGVIALEMGDFVRPRDGFYAARVRSGTTPAWDGLLLVDDRAANSARLGSSSDRRLVPGITEVELLEHVCDAGTSRRARALQHALMSQSAT